MAALYTGPSRDEEPDGVQTLRLEILAPGPGTGTYALSATINPDQRRTDVWQALFPASTAVHDRGNVDTFKTVPIISYSQSNVVDVVLPELHSWMGNVHFAVPSAPYTV